MVMYTVYVIADEILLRYNAFGSVAFQTKQVPNLHSVSIFRSLFHTECS